MSLKFRTAYGADSGKYISESGSPYLDQYEYEFDEKGEVKSTVLHKTDKPLNVQERIDADYDSTDINLLMKRFSLGDTSAIDVKQGIYADVTKMPTTFAELFDRVNDSHRLFDDLPSDLKELFNNSYEEFWSTFGSDDFNKKVDEYNDRFIDHSFDDDVSNDVLESEVNVDE